MTPYETFHSREQYLMHAIEHCVSVIALCRVSHSFKAELAYEQLLADHTEELRALRIQQEVNEETRS